MPPAVFPVILGLLGLGLALREVGDPLAGLAEIGLGAVAGLWVFSVLAYASKVVRRPAVLVEEMRVLPGRLGLATASVGGLALAAVIAPYAPGFGRGVLVAGLALQAGLALLAIRVLIALPPEARTVTPAFHLHFVGFIVGGLAAPGLGWPGLALVLLWATIPVAAVIWGVSLAQLITRVPPAPLRPLLAIHLAPASLFASVAALTGQALLAQVAVGLGAAILTALVVSGRWIIAAGVTPMWGAFTFSLAAFAGAMLRVGGGWKAPGLVLTVILLGAIPMIAWSVLRQWPGGKLAAKTNAVEA